MRPLSAPQHFARDDRSSRLSGPSPQLFPSGNQALCVVLLLADRAGTAYAVDGQYKECMAEFDRAQTDWGSRKKPPPGQARDYSTGRHDSRRKCELFVPTCSHGRIRRR